MSRLRHGSGKNPFKAAKAETPQGNTNVLKLARGTAPIHGGDAPKHGGLPGKFKIMARPRARGGCA